MFLTINLSIIYLLAASVAGHGYLGGVTVDGKYYRGFNNTSESGKSPPPHLIAWTVNNLDMNAVYPPNYTHPDIICGISATPGTQTAPVRAGSNVTFQWAPRWYDSHEGPISTWLAPCNGPCSKAKKEDLEFFKISEMGWSPEGGATWATGGTWAVDVLMRNNLTWTTRIPKSVKSGNYVLRFEIIALQMAFAEGAEVYPACVNIEITGDGKDSPKGMKATQFYDPTEDGFHTFLYNPITSYKIPGPKLWTGALSKT